jgi:hypothetical protein
MNDQPEPVPAVSVVVPSPANQTALRDRVVAAIKASPFQELRSVDAASNGPLRITVKVDDLADVLLRRLATTLPACSDPIECSHEAALGEAQQEARRLRLMVDEYGAGASALTDKLKQLRDIGRRLAAHAVGFQDVLDDSDRDPWAKTVGADIAALCETLDAPAAALLPAPVDRAAPLTDAERTMLTYALDQAQEKIWSEDGFTDEDQAAVTSLRRLAAEATPQDTEAHPPHDSWLVEVDLPDVEGWHVAYPTEDKVKALERLERGRRESPDHEWRLVRETTSYAVEPAAVVQPQPDETQA